MRPVLLLTLSVWPSVLASVPFAVKRQNVPDCVANCIIAAGQAIGCSVQNFACLCDSATFIDDSVACYVQTCSEADLETGVQLGLTACQQIGITPSIPAEAQSLLASATASRATVTTTMPTTTTYAQATPSPSSASPAATTSSMRSKGHRVRSPLTWSTVLVTIGLAWF